MTARGNPTSPPTTPARARVRKRGAGVPRSAPAKVSLLQPVPTGTARASLTEDSTRTPGKPVTGSLKLSAKSEVKPRRTPRSGGSRLEGKYKDAASPENRSEGLEGSVAVENSNGSSSRLSGLGPEELSMLDEERPAVKKVLEDFCSRAVEVRAKVSALVGRVKEEAEQMREEGPRDEGGSYVAAKQLLLLSYCRELCAYACCKVAPTPPPRAPGNSDSWEHSKGSLTLPFSLVPWRLVELRTVLEKLRPLDSKLKYHTEKLLRLASTTKSHDRAGEGEEGDSDPLSFRPRPDAMLPWGEGEKGARDVQEGRAPGGEISGSGLGTAAVKGEASGAPSLEKYRPPRIASTPYHLEDENSRGGGSKGERRKERMRDRLRRGEVLETLREEYGDHPEAIRHDYYRGHGVSEARLKRMGEEDKARKNFEEEHMVRLTMSRKGKKERKRLEKEAGRLETIADVGSAADFVQVAQDSGWGLGGGNQHGEQDFSQEGKKRKGHGGSSHRSGGSSALGLALGAVGRSMARGSASQGGRQGRKRSRGSP